MELMTEAAYNKRVTLEQTFFIEEKNMKDIQKLRFKVGPIATYNSANDGLTPLICRGRTAKEQAFLVKREAAMEETARTRTLDDALAKPKYEPRFPDNFHDLKIMTDTFMIMIWVLFGEWSPLYVQLQQVSMLLSERQVQMTARAYSKGACYRIMWALYEEVRRFCDQGLLADAFKSTSRVMFPQAYINAFLNDIRVGNTIMRLSYPSELQKLEYKTEDGQGGGGRGRGDQNNGGGTGRGRGGNQNQQGGRGGGGRGMGGYYNNNNGGGGYNNYNGGGGNNNNNNNYSGGGGGYPNNGYSNNNNQSRMPSGGNMNNSYNNFNNNNRGQGLKNAKIEAMMRAYRQKYPGAVNVFLILDECGYRLTDLPAAGIIDKDTGKQMFCWSYGLGCCTYPNCRFAAAGGHPETVPDEFADAACALLGPCMQKILNGGQSPNKRPRSEGGGAQN